MPFLAFPQSVLIPAVLADANWLGYPLSVLVHSDHRVVEMTSQRAKAVVRLV